MPGTSSMQMPLHRSSRRLMNEVSSSSQTSTSALPPRHEVDHNYPQPDRTRNTRRTLSRHQRNADELDPLQCPPTSELNHSSSRLRSSTVTVTDTIVQRRTYIHPSTSTSVSREDVSRRRISQVRQMNESVSCLLGILIPVSQSIMVYLRL